MTDVADDAGGAGRKILGTMLDRLFAALVNGPGLNCRPHRSRQRVDFAQLAKLGDVAPAAALERLLGGARKVTLKARTPQPKRKAADDRGEEVATHAADAARDAALAAAERAWDEQAALLNKLHVVAEDARTYEQDTGVHVLNVGFPLLSLPPGAFDAGAGGGGTRRVLAPIAFVPVSLSLKRGATKGVEIACRGEGIDLVQPNAALLAWLERQTGHDLTAAADAFADERGENPWREIGQLVRLVCQALELDPPAAFAEMAAAPGAEGDEARPPAPDPAGETLVAADAPPDKTPVSERSDDPDSSRAGNPGLRKAQTPASPPDPSPPKLSCTLASLVPAPRGEDADDRARVLMSAVLGLFPVANQGLLRDVQAMAGGEPLAGPVESFVRVGASLEPPPSAAAPDAATPTAEPVERRARDFGQERLVAPADPCQARAVRLARESRGLVVHGPPGTGKSQTITNIVGDHLARGQRVLFVCDKRTALDVVYNRLEHMGLGRLVAVVHDPRRDQRELYRTLKQQLEDLAEATTDPRAVEKLHTVDAELQKLHGELTAYRAALMDADPATHLSFHDLVGQWMAMAPDSLAPVPRGEGRGEGRIGELARLAEVRPPRPLTPTLSLAHRAEGDQTRLADLDARQADLHEILRRGADVDWANNPWRDRLGVGLRELLDRPADFYRMAVASIADAARVADATIHPDTPPLAPLLDLAAQADSRVAFASELEPLVRDAPPELLARWAGRLLAELPAIRAKLTEVRPYVQAMRAKPLDAELLAAAIALPTRQALAERREALQKYAEAFETWAAWVGRLQQAAPTAPLATIARWVIADDRTFDAARAALAAVAPLADRAAAAAPLDAELAAPYRRQPFGLPQVLQWQGALETYLPTAGSLFAFLHGGKRRAAEPAAQFFGVGLSADAGRRLRDFLAALRARLEVRQALAAALGGPAAALPEADDPALLALFREHFGVLDGAAHLQRQPPASPPSPGQRMQPIADATDLVHRLIARELDAATPLFAEFGLFPNPANTTRLRGFYDALAVRLILQDFHREHLGGGQPADALTGDDELARSVETHARLLDLILRAARDPLLAGVSDRLRLALSDSREHGPALITGLRRSPARAAALAALERALAEAGLFAPAWLADVAAAARAGGAFAPTVVDLAARLDSFEGIVRARALLAALPAPLGSVVGQLLAHSAGPDEGWAAMRRAALAGEITRRLAADAQLQGLDGRRLQSTFDRYRALETRKQALARDVVLDHWVGRQRERLLADTGKRLNGAGTELRRRLTLRGRNATRLRQVVALGRRIEGGDPLFDLAPVWMASPETVAQVFPREAVFDVVVFDEASQCRLEEALPVLTRGRRVVIAGDPKQLPPTRFFESAVSRSDGDGDEVETEQDLFEVQQGEVEDLLAAALGLEIEQCYLDVHYRSRSAALIAFSNEHFYGSRLQPLPGRPTGARALPPITMHRADGTYADRRNEIEADAVCEIVAELLARRDPPSIGIACFNLPQRDLVMAKLDERAEADARFAKRLAAARERTGPGSFEGLFVKNLENVQGDERDHVILSTTYGPDAAGRFYRRFGPLGMPGGARRLNVLVTRARAHVHVVTSIPREQYATLPALEPGQTPGGAWLLFAYLNFADRLDPQVPAVDQVSFADPTEREPVVDEPSSADPTEPGSVTPDGPEARTSAPDTSDAPPAVIVHPTRTPTALVPALAAALAARGVGSDVYWGNDGFCVDLALRSPAAPDEAVVGVLCDGARYPAAEDPTQWDVFRTGVFEAQGWRLRRVWTPHLFRDPTGTTESILRAVGAD